MIEKLSFVVRGWFDRLGDPSWGAWLAAAGYLTCAGLCLLAGRSRPRPWGWRALAAAYAFLGFNKQLDFQSLLTAAGRLAFRELGLYEDRRRYQIAFIALVSAVAAAASVAAWRRIRIAGRGAGFAAFGFNLIAAYSVIRAASFHHVDALLRLDAAGLRLGGAFELSGILAACIGAALAIRDAKWRVRHRTRPRPGVLLGSKASPAVNRRNADPTARRPAAGGPTPFGHSARRILSIRGKAAKPGLTGDDSPREPPPT